LESDISSLWNANRTLLETIDSRQRLTIVHHLVHPGMTFSPWITIKRPKTDKVFFSVSKPLETELLVLAVVSQLKTIRTLEETLTLIGIARTTVWKTIKRYIHTTMKDNTAYRAITTLYARIMQPTR